MLVIRFRDPRGVDFPYLLSMLKESFMSRAQYHRSALAARCLSPCS